MHCVLSCFSHIQLFVTIWTVAFQAPLLMGFSQQEYWSGLPFPTPGDLLNPEIKPTSLASPALAGEFFITVPPGKTYMCVCVYVCVCMYVCMYVYTYIYIYAAKSLQSCPTLCDPINGSPLGSSVPGILQARILEWVAVSFSNEWKWKVKMKSPSHPRLLATPRTAAYQAPPSMGFSRQEPCSYSTSKTGI